MMTWEPTTESQKEADRIVYGSFNANCYRLAALGAAWFLFCWAVTR